MNCTRLRQLKWYFIFTFNLGKVHCCDVAKLNQSRGYHDNMVMTKRGVNSIALRRQSLLEGRPVSVSKGKSFRMEENC